jgi:SAM-dependent methyltransferase|tara:strand:+ start:374 stop:1246 length:873 start_codon:yes stop_codon:yes gene_type:complete
MSDLKCNICQSINIDNFLIKDNWEIVRCGNCKIVFVKSIPSDRVLEDLYDDNFFKDGQKFPTEGLDLHSNPTYINALKRIERIKEYDHCNDRLLDVGCATGIFLKAANASFKYSFGIDISKYATDVAVRELNVNVKCGTILDLNFSQQYFDVITMWDVIEHVKDPSKYIDKISNIIRPGGLMILSTGNIESIMFKIQKKKWHLLIPPKHLFYFSPKTISMLLNNYGLRVLNIANEGQYTNIGYMIDKFKRLHEKNKAISILNTVIRRFNLNQYNIYLNLYDVMTVYARKL